MNLEGDNRLNLQLRLDFSSAPTGEARQAGQEDIESLSAVHEPERPANTCSKRVSATSRTAVYGAVRTVVWEGRSCEAPPYPDQHLRRIVFKNRAAACVARLRVVRATSSMLARGPLATDHFSEYH